MGSAIELTFQATDLARRHREVMDAARRPEGVAIRDKDGVTFVIVPAAGVRQDRYVLAGLTDAIRVMALLRSDPADADPLLYGSLAWLAALPRQAQEEFVWEYLRALQAVAGTGTEAVDEVLYEWQQTARAWSDERLRGELRRDVPVPLADVEL